MKILVTNDDETVKVEIVEMPDPMGDPDEPGEPWYRATCRVTGCHWDSFVDENTVHTIESDAINDAEYHIEHEHEHADF